MTIFIDLDDCLIHSVPTKDPNPDYPSLTLPKETYSVQQRAMAHSMLADCRGLGQTKLLTSATRPYAEGINSLFSFGFHPKDMITFEDYLSEVPTLYGRKDTILLHERTCPDAILIDNQPPHNIWAKVKQRYLGIPEDQYFQVPAFYGQNDQTFAKVWEEIIKSIRNKIFQISHSPSLF